MRIEGEDASRHREGGAIHFALLVLPLRYTVDPIQELFSLLDRLSPLHSLPLVLRDILATITIDITPTTR